MKAIFYLVVFSIFFVPLSGAFPMPGMIIWDVQQLALITILFLGTSLFLWKFNKWISIFNVICVISAIFFSNENNSFSSLPITMFPPTLTGLRSLLHINLACLAMYGISSLDNKQRRVILKSLFIFFIIQSVWVIVQKLNMDFIFDMAANSQNDDTVGFSGSPNQIGVFFAAISPIVFYFAWWLLPLNIFALICSYTFTAWIAFVVAMFGCVYAFKRKALPFLLILIIPTFIFVKYCEKFNLGPVQQRLSLFKLTIDQAVKGKMTLKSSMDLNTKEPVIYRYLEWNPIFGVGLGNFFRLSPYSQYKILDEGTIERERPKHRYLQAHNDWIEHWLETGWIGLASMVSIFITFILSFIKADKTKILTVLFLSIIAYILCAQGVFAVRTAVSAMFFVVLMGLYYGELRDIKELKNGKVA